MSGVPAMRPTRRHAAERGVVMWVALVVLIVMSLAGLAMMRQIGGGMSIAGNVAFKENATASADAGTEMARAWYTDPANIGSLEADALTQGYHATWGPTVDPTQMNWTNAESVLVTLDSGIGNDSRYQIHRLCAITGPVTAAAQTCSDQDKCKLPTANTATGCNKGSGTYNDPNSQPDYSPYYRITVRTQGPRNTISYTQVITN